MLAILEFFKSIFKIYSANIYCIPTMLYNKGQQMEVYMLNLGCSLFL